MSIPTNRRYFILVGDPETWKVSLAKNIWGFSEKSKGFWNKSNPEDCLSFYVTSPFKKIIGFGKVNRKFIDESHVFPDEKFFKKTLWPYRMAYDKFFVIDDWEQGIGVPSNFMLNVGRKVIDRKNFVDLATKAEQEWHQSIIGQFN